MKGQSTNLTAAELKAIEEHKYYLSQQRGTEVSIEEAIDDFVQHFAEDWRKEKLRRDNLAQRDEIEKHKYLRSMAEGRDIGGSSAAEEWCQKYAHIWRKERESLQRNGFESILVTIHNKDGLHLRPVSAVAALAAQFDCDIYVHKDGMTYYNFLLDGRPYMNVRSILGLLSVGTVLGDTLVFIAAGSQAVPALRALSELLAKEPPEVSPVNR
jgi:phosphotransferase system HPr (HPr) family protein